ncbi:hypothetical protein FKM82_003419 [Ascaphus truei]
MPLSLLVGQGNAGTLTQRSLPGSDVTRSREMWVSWTSVCLPFLCVTILAPNSTRFARRMKLMYWSNVYIYTPFLRMVKYHPNYIQITLLTFVKSKNMFNTN